MIMEQYNTEQSTTMWSRTEGNKIEKISTEKPQETKMRMEQNRAEIE